MPVRDKIKGLFILWTFISGLQAGAQTTIPEPLEPWRDWVLYGEEYRNCPVLNGASPGLQQSHICAWPGRLELDVAGDGARFTQTWTLHSEGWVPLPGDQQHWPADVLVDGISVAVGLRTGRPVLRLAAGSYRVSGMLSWETRPAAIPVPHEIGLVSVVLDGAAMNYPELRDGQVWLGLVTDVAAEDDRLSINVYRLLRDGLPVILETRIELDVAGRNREILLPGGLLDGFAGLALSSGLPAQLDADGMLRVQVRPGRWVVDLTSRAGGLMEELQAPVESDFWPGEEIWSYEPDSRLRIATLEGLASVDAARSGVPENWNSFPAYSVTAGQQFNLTERNRSSADDENRLTLDRHLWLDFDGDGYSVLDHVLGQMRSGWRLDMTAPYLMTSARAHGDDMLVTASPEPGAQGIELRGADVSVRDTARLVPQGGLLPVTGYREAFSRLQTTLHLPPGYRLFAAPGADSVNGSWVAEWRLLDIFLVLVIAAGTWRLFGRLPGLLALVALVLTFHEPGAPAWAWLNLLVVLALLRAAPEGRLKRFCGWYRNASVIGLVLLLIPFVAGELRTVVFPQLEHARLQRGISMPRLDIDSQLDGIGFSRESGRESENAQRSVSSIASLEEVVATGRRESSELTRFEPGALVQTGPGLPDWMWNRYTLNWSGPIEADQSYRLVVLGPWQVGLWRVAGVVLLLVLLWALTRKNIRLPAVSLRPGSGAASLLLLLCAISLPFDGEAQQVSEFPSSELLEELRQRLSEPAVCHPGCAELAEAVVVLEDDILTLSLDLALQDAVAVPMPGDVSGWRPDSITIDGAPESLLYRSPGGLPWLPLNAGVHSVVLRGRIPATDNFVLPFNLAPRRVQVTAADWQVSGINEQRLLSGSIEFIRQPAADTEGELQVSEFPPYVSVTRELSFDLDWTVRTRVERIAPEAAAFTLPVSLLPGEAVVSPGIEVNGDIALIAMAAGEYSVFWESNLPPGDMAVLVAPEEAPWMETWIFSISPIWHAEFEGLPATMPDTVNSLFYSPEYHPRPGETLTVNLTRPIPSAGDTMAIDAVDYVTELGERSSRSILRFDYRSTQGAQHAIRLPGNSELQTVTMDGRVLPLLLNDGIVEIPIEPGGHQVSLIWTLAGEIGINSTLPIVDLGAGASNLLSRMELPSDRWVLFAFGPTLGPAVLYWPELLTFLLVALGLSRLKWSPLRMHEWLLFGLGLSTFAWPVILLFAIWVFALSWRGQAELNLGSRLFNGLQLGLGMLSVLTLMAVVVAIPVGLLGQPDMQIISPVQSSGLSWFLDQTAGTTPEVSTISVSLWFYKAAMLLWALWLSFALLRWFPWAWKSFSHDGIWRGRVASRGA